MAVDALVGQPAQVLGVDRPEDDAIVVAVQSGWAWQVRCIEAELRGDATVLTYVESRPAESAAWEDPADVRNEVL